MPCPPPLIGPPPPNHMAEMIMNKCAIECGKQRHGDGTMSPCPKHPHTGKGFWTAAGQFIPLEGWDQGKSSYANNFNVANTFLLLPYYIKKACMKLIDRPGFSIISTCYISTYIHGFNFSVIVALAQRSLQLSSINPLQHENIGGIYCGNLIQQRQTN